ncbi:MAG: carboxylating nicotinate-nucleotide diphosphorylase [Candidatus Gastranaerophilaceae bacterium]
MLSKFYIEDHVKMALEEDIGFGDITTENLASDDDFLSGELNTRSEGVLCGCEVFKTVFKILSDDIKIKFYFKDGDRIKKGDKIADISGPAKYLLMGERVSLNYIQRMSGIATETRKYQDAIAPYNAKIVDTRKTTPNFRAFEKYSVKVGGGALHRFNLSDCAMIKDNHIRLAGSITNAVTKLRANISHAHKIEVECDTLEQVKEAVEVKADIIMLDNMSVENMKKAVEIINHSAVVEASGNVNLETVNDIASTGVDIISSSAIVAKAPTLDLGLDI